MYAGKEKNHEYNFLSGTILVIKIQNIQSKNCILDIDDWGLSLLT